MDITMNSLPEIKNKEESP